MLDICHPGTDLHVIKFGGSSVIKPKAVLVALNHYGLAGSVVVVSALKDVTDKLLKVYSSQDVGIQNNILGEIINQHLDLLDETLTGDQNLDALKEELKAFFDIKIAETRAENSFTTTTEQYKIDNWAYLGELFSAYLLKKVLTRLQLGATFQMVDLANSVDKDSPLTTPAKIGEALREEIRHRLQNTLIDASTAIVPGHIKGLPAGGIMEVTDRGYSDWTAVEVARALVAWNNVSLIISKEIDSLFSADPKLVGDAAKSRSVITLLELAELADGAGIKAVNPGAAVSFVDFCRTRASGENNITMEVKNTFAPAKEGTKVIENSGLAQENVGVRFVSGKRGQAIVRVSCTEMIAESGWLADVGNIAKKHAMPIGVLSGSNSSIVFAMDQDHPSWYMVKAEIVGLGRGRKIEVEQIRDKAIIYCVGHYLSQDPAAEQNVNNAITKSGIRSKPLANDFRCNYLLVVDDTDENFRQAIIAANSVAAN